MGREVPNSSSPEGGPHPGRVMASSAHMDSCVAGQDGAQRRPASTRPGALGYRPSGGQAHRTPARAPREQLGADGGGDPSSFLRSCSFLSSLLRKEVQGWGWRSTEPASHPQAYQPRAVTGARAPKACLWGCQGPVCAHPRPGSCGHNSAGGTPGRRAPRGATRAADPKLKFIFPTVADSWSGCGGRGEGKFCPQRAGRWPGSPPTRDRGQCVRATSPRGGRQSAVGCALGPGAPGAPPGSWEPRARRPVPPPGAHPALPQPPSPAPRAPSLGLSFPCGSWRGGAEARTYRAGARRRSLGSGQGPRLPAHRGLRTARAGLGFGWLGLGSRCAGRAEEEVPPRPASPRPRGERARPGAESGRGRREAPPCPARRRRVRQRGGSPLAGRYPRGRRPQRSPLPHPAGLTPGGRGWRWGRSARSGGLGNNWKRSPHLRPHCRPPPWSPLRPIFSPPTPPPGPAPTGSHRAQGQSQSRAVVHLPLPPTWDPALASWIPRLRVPPLRASQQSSQGPPRMGSEGSGAAWTGWACRQQA